MATAAGALFVDFGTNSASFIRDMGKSARAVNSNSARMNKSLARLDRGFLKVRKSLARMAKRTLSLRGAVATLAGGAGLGLLIKRSLDVADSIAKTADAAGISTDALQEYRFAAQLSGVATEQFDKSLLQIGKRMGELRTRTDSELITALKNFDAELLENIRNASSQEAALDLVFRKMGSLTDQTQRIALATAVFGRSGILMTNIVRGGAQELDNMRQKARDLGIVIEESLLRNAENAKDQLFILGQVIGTNVTQAILKAAPQIADMAKQFADAIPEILNTTRAFLEFIGVLEKSRIQKMNEDIAALTVRIKALNEELETPLGPRTEGPGVERLERLIDERDVLLARVRVLETPVKPAAAGAPAPSPGAAPGAGGLVARAPTFDALDLTRARLQAEQASLAALKAEGGAVALVASEHFRLGEAAKEAAQARAEAAEASALVIVRAGETAVEVYNREIQELKDLREELAKYGKSRLLTEEQFQRASAQAVERLKERQKAEQEARRTTDEMTEAQRRLVDRGLNLVDQAIAGNIRGWRDWARIAINEIRRVLNEILRNKDLFKFDPVMTSGGGGFLGGLLGLFGGGGGGGLGPQFTGTGALGLLSSGSFAHGGRPPVGRVAIVGEKGPEPFIPDRPGTILPNSALSGLGGGVTNIYNIDARNAKFGVEQDIIRALNDLDRSIEPRALAVVSFKRGRGGGFSRSFGSF